MGPRARAALGFLLCAFIGVGGCGVRRAVPGLRRPGWQTVVAWGGAGFRLGRTPSGVEYGPLAAALSPCCLAVADSFGGRVLVWLRRSFGWRGPQVLRLPSPAPVVVLSFGGPGSRTLAAADAACEVWLAAPGRAARRLAAFARGDGLCQVLALAVTRRGAVWADVAYVGRGCAQRLLYALAPGGGPARPLALATVAGSGRHGASATDWLLPPPGVRAGLVGDGDGVWVAGRAAGGRPALWRIGGGGGRQPGARPIPALPAPVDLLALGPGGRLYLTAGTGRGGLALVAVDPHGRRVGWRALPSTGGPELGQYAAVGADGAVLLLEPGRRGLALQWFARGRFFRR